MLERGVALRTIVESSGWQKLHRCRNENG
jgi:hypothetical protein